MIDFFRIFNAPATIVVVATLLLSLAAPSFGADKDDKSKGPLPINEIKRDEPVDFQREILPILRKNCLACHNATDHEADLNLETPKTILKGGDLGPAVEPGNSIDSLLLLLSAHQEQPFMPPAKNKVGAKNLAPDELGLIKLWIEQGAKGEVTEGLGPVDWQPLPVGLNQIFAVAVSPDGVYAAAGRANQIFVYNIVTKQLVTRLTDPALLKLDPAYKPGAAHLDFVQSLAFSPDGSVLASGGYRTVKLWKRPSAPKVLDIAIESVAKDQPAPAAAISSDGKWIAVAMPDHSVQLRDAKSGKVAHTLKGHSALVADLQFSADGTHLLSVGHDKVARVWQVADGKEVGQIETPSEVTAGCWLKEGKLIATAGKDKIIRLWNTPGLTDAKSQENKEEKAKDEKSEEKKEGETADEGPAPVREIKGHGNDITALVPLPGNDSQFLSASLDNTARWWNADDGNQIRQFNHGGPVADVAVRSDGQRIATAGLNNTSKLFDANGGQKAELKDSHAVLAYSDHMQRMVKLAGDEVNYRKSRIDEAEKRHKAEVDNVKKAEQALEEVVKDFKKKTEAFEKAKKEKADAEKAKVEADKALAEATKARDAAVKAAEEAEAALKKQREDLEAARKAQQEADAEVKKQEEAKNKAGDDAKAKEAAEKALAQAMEKAKQAAETVKKAEESLKAAEEKAKATQDGKRDAEKALADATNKQKQAEKELENKMKPFTEAENDFKQAENAKSSGENRVAVAKESVTKAEQLIADAKAEHKSAEEAKTKTDADLEAARKAVGESQKPFHAVAFSPDGHVLHTADAAGRILTWSSEEGQRLEVRTAHDARIDTLAVTPDGVLLSAAADPKSTVALWNTQEPWMLAGRIGESDSSSPLVDRVIALDFHPDGKHLATGGGVPSRSGELKIWNVETGQLVHEIVDAHSDTVFDVEYSFDGKFLASGAADKFAKVWNVAALPDDKVEVKVEPVRSFEGHTHHVLGVGWQADGRTLVTAGADTAMKVWNVVTGEQKRTINNFSKEVTGVDFVAIDDQFIAVAGDRQVRRMRENGGNVRNYGGPSDFMYALDITPDGRIVIAGGEDSVLRIWEADNGKEIVKFEPPAPEKK